MSVAVTNKYYDTLAEIFDLPKEQMLGMKLIMNPGEVVRIELQLAPKMQQVDVLMENLKEFMMMEKAK